MLPNGERLLVPKPETSGNLLVHLKYNFARFKDIFKSHDLTIPRSLAGQSWEDTTVVEFTAKQLGLFPFSDFNFRFIFLLLQKRKSHME